VETVRVQSPLIIAIGISVLVLPAFAAPSVQGKCELPSDLREAVSKEYPNARVVQFADLSEHDKELFQKDHGADECPGLVKVDFYGDGRPTWGMVLISDTNTSNVVVAHEVKNWEFTAIEKAVTPSPVVWSEKPGKYDDLYGEKTIHATWPVIVVCEYESW